MAGEDIVVDSFIHVTEIATHVLTHLCRARQSHDEVPVVWEVGA
jgi:hypothetical protein